MKHRNIGVLSICRPSICLSQKSSKLWSGPFFPPVIRFVRYLEEGIQCACNPPPAAAAAHDAGGGCPSKNNTTARRLLRASELPLWITPFSSFFCKKHFFFLFLCSNGNVQNKNFNFLKLQIRIFEIAAGEKTWGELRKMLW